MKKYIDIEGLRAFMRDMRHSDFERQAKRLPSDPEPKIFRHPSGNAVPVGEYFLSDCDCNTVQLCIATKRLYRNGDGRLVDCRVVATLIPNATDRLGAPVNGVWAVPDHLYL